jgi:hypothetical protein
LGGDFIALLLVPLFELLKQNSATQVGLYELRRRSEPL